MQGPSSAPFPIGLTESWRGCRAAVATTDNPTWDASGTSSAFTLSAMKLMPMHFLSNCTPGGGVVSA